MPDPKDRLGSSGVFKAIVEGARAFKRALSESDPDMPPEAQELGDKIAQAFIAGRFADVHAMGTPGFVERQKRESFASSWAQAVEGRGPFTGYEVVNVGQIDLGFIPGLEETPQDHFVAFLEIAFSSPDIAVDDDRAFVVGAVLLDEGGGVRLGALHTR